MSDERPEPRGDEPATRKRRKRDRPRRAAAAEAAVVPLDDRLSGPRAWLAAAAVVACLGVALVGVGPSELGATLVLAGLVGLVAGVHFVGRMGPG